MKRTILFIFFCLNAFILIVGCAGTAGSITDVSGNKTIVRRMTISPSSSIKILDGNAVRSIQLKSLKQVIIHTRETRNIEGDLFYLATLVFRDKKSDEKKYGNENNKGKTFISISGVLEGRSKGGNYRITLDKVSEIDFIYKD